MADQRDKAPGMGIVKKRRSRKMLETRDASDRDGTETGAAAAAAWGDHLEAKVRDGVDDTPDPVKPDTPAPDDRVAAVSNESAPRPRVKARPASTSRRRPRELPEFLRDQPDVGPVKPGKKKVDVEDVLHNIADQQQSYEERSEFKGGEGFSVRRNRLWLSLLAVLVAGVLAGTPVYFEWAKRTHAQELQAVLNTHATKIARARPDLAKLVEAGRFGELRALYAQHHPQVVEAVRGAGFEEVLDQHVTLRVDFKAAALVLGVGIEQDDGSDPIAAQASTSGRPVGRPMPEASIKAAMAENVLNLVTFLLLALLTILGLYLGPALVEVLESRRGRAEAARRAARERAEYAEMLEDE